MFLDIVTPEKKVFSGEIKLISVPGNSGYFEVMQNHAAILSTLKAGKMKIIEESGDQKHFQIDGGLIEVKGNNIIVLAEKLVSKKD